MIRPAIMRDLDEIETILNSCLEMVRMSHGPVDSILEQYPDIKEVLKPPLEAARWLVNQQSGFDPFPEYRVRARSRILCTIRRKARGEYPMRGRREKARNLPLFMLN
jgi:hypothetical protein